jgi:hypothetical protein
MSEQLTPQQAQALLMLLEPQIQHARAVAELVNTLQRIAKPPQPEEPPKAAE